MTQRIRMEKRISSVHTLWCPCTQWWKKPDECEVLLSPEAKWRSVKRGGSDFRSHLCSHIPGNSGNSNSDTTNMSTCYMPGLCPVPSQTWSHLVLRSVLEDGWASPFSKHEEIKVRKIKITGLLNGELGNGPKASNSLSVISLSSQDRMHLQSCWTFFI